LSLGSSAAAAGRTFSWFAAFGIAAAIVGCKSDALPSSSTSAQASSASTPLATSAPAGTTRDEVHGGIRFLVLFRGGADEHSPLIVGIHGRGGSPERFSRVFRDFSGRAELAFAQGPSRSGDGWSWLPMWSSDDADFVAAFDAAEKQLWQAIAHLSHGRRVIVTGFSQGGMLSYVLAARHPREIAYAFPMAGGAPPALLPHDHAPTAPVYALHGTSDPVIDVSIARSTVAAFREQGAKAELREFAGVDHDMPPALREDLLSHVRAEVDAENARAAPLGSAAHEGRTGNAPGVREGDAAPEPLR
jgi:phospholipase/carboxylesterase